MAQPQTAKKVVTPTSAAAKTDSRSAAKSNDVLPFTRTNYVLSGVALAILVLGYFLLSLEDFIDATQFSIALYVAPFVILSGYGFFIYAIMKRDKPAENGTTGQA
jgi:uncharacterized RDD family membrane protein YckC